MPLPDDVRNLNKRVKRLPSWRAGWAGRLPQRTNRSTRRPYLGRGGRAGARKRGLGKEADWYETPHFVKNANSAPTTSSNLVIDQSKSNGRRIANSRREEVQVRPETEERRAVLKVFG